MTEEFIPVRKFFGTETKEIGRCANDSLALMEFCKSHGEGEYLCGKPDDLLILRVKCEVTTFATPVVGREEVSKVIGGKSDN